MRIIPVLDLMGGQVVRGVAGRREEYRPIVSRLTDSSWPLEVARAFREHFGLTELYVADLDAIAGAPPSVGMYTQLRADGFRLWVDAGVRDAQHANVLGRAGIEKIVVGLETVSGPAALATVIQDLGGQRIVFSLDLKNGEPLGNVSAWNAPDAWAIAAQAIEIGARHLLFLDLARVGVGTGTGTEGLCRKAVAAFPNVEIVVGGGVRGLQDLQHLRESGVHAVLIASALHDGRLTHADVNAVY